MAGTLPDVRLLILLRDPVDRLFSHYYHAVRGMRPLPEINAFIRTHPRLIGNSLYAGGIRRVFDLFPAEQILVLFFDDLKNDPAALLKRTCSHIGVTPPDLPPAQTAPVGRGFLAPSPLLERWRHTLFQKLYRRNKGELIRQIRRWPLTALLLSAIKRPLPARTISILDPAILHRLHEDLDRLSLPFATDIPNRWPASLDRALDRKPPE